MGRYFNIGGPCNPADHYTLPAMARLPQVVSLIGKKQYFVVHAQRQCGKTTAFLALANEMNAKDEAVAIYCSLEAVQEFPEAERGVPKICALIQDAIDGMPEFGALAGAEWPIAALAPDAVIASGVKVALSRMAAKIAPKPLVIFFDEVDCLGGPTLITFLRQLRNGKIDSLKGVAFPTSVALIGMRDIRDYKAKIRPDSETIGSASPFNVITKAMTLRVFTAEEVAELYAQHTAATGQAFESEAVRLAFEFSGGQPYLVNALARWCVEEIHGERYGETITAADMCAAKEKIVRERPGYLNSIWKRARLPCVDRLVEAMASGKIETVPIETLRSAEGFGVVRKENGGIVYANEIVKDAIMAYRNPSRIRSA